MDENPHYGELSKVPVYKLRQVMNYLMLNEHSPVTNDEYAIVKLTGKSKLILEEDETDDENGEGAGASCEGCR